MLGSGNGTYYMKVGSDVIDGDVNGNEARFINHSCNPNCSVKVLKIGGKSRSFIFAVRKIKKGMELTFDYGWTCAVDKSKTQCFCSARKYCRGYIERYC